MIGRESEVVEVAAAVKAHRLVTLTGVGGVGKTRLAEVPMKRTRVALVTGASRGVGAEVARGLGGTGAHVIVNCREKLKRAHAVVAEIVAAGGSASALAADVTDPAAVVAMMRQIGGRFGTLDVLVLNASGGLERDADRGYPMRVNHDAQVRLVRRALPLMPRGARIVFVTSHQAHFNGRMPIPDFYLAVAQTKRAGEDALRAMRAQLVAHDVGLVVVSGDMIDGTIVVRLLERRDPGTVAERRAHGPLPTVEQFAGAVVAATIDPHDFGETVYIGGTDYTSGDELSEK
ncbi:MAG: SDR family oxidoreductase [Mycobacterium sp.]